MLPLTSLQYHKGEYKIFFWIILANSITPLLPTLMGWIPEQKRTKEEPGMMAFCGQLLIVNVSGIPGEESSIHADHSLWSMPRTVVSIICLAGPDIGLISAVFCIATFKMFPQKVSLCRYIVSLGVLLYVHACTHLLLCYDELFYSGSVLFGSLCPSSSPDCRQSRSHH